MKRQTDITITGSEGLIGSTLCKYFKKKGRSVKKLDIKLGHDLTNERFVKKWFKENPTQYVLINLLADLPVLKVRHAQMIVWEPFMALDRLPRILR